MTDWQIPEMFKDWEKLPTLSTYIARMTKINDLMVVYAQIFADVVLFECVLFPNSRPYWRSGPIKITMDYLKANQAAILDEVLTKARCKFLAKDHKPQETARNRKKPQELRSETRPLSV